MTTDSRQTYTFQGPIQNADTYPEHSKHYRLVPECTDPAFAKTSPKRSFSKSENNRFGLVLAKTGSINSGIGVDTVYVHIDTRQRTYIQI